MIWVKFMVEVVDVDDLDAKVECPNCDKEILVPVTSEEHKCPYCGKNLSIEKHDGCETCEAYIEEAKKSRRPVILITTGHLEGHILGVA